MYKKWGGNEVKVNGEEWMIVELKDIVASVDPDAFVIVSDVREVLGEGFLEYHGNR